MDAKKLLQMHSSRNGIPRCYELNGTRTVSVRDQMLRATSIVAALATCADSRQLSPGSTLLVAGGGAAGAAVALSAAKIGIKVALLETKSALFQQQWSVTSRIIDPTEFDWPRSHWEQPAWPPTQGRFKGALAFPLSYDTAAFASVHASQWDLDLIDWLDDHETAVKEGRDPQLLLEVHCGVEVAIPPVKQPAQSSVATLHTFPDRIEATCAKLGWAARRFDAVISCVGHGTEKVCDSGPTSFRGPEFWATDTIDDPDFGLPVKKSDPIHVVVSGGGDGAQQDIQRAICGAFGRRLLDRAGIDLREAANHVNHNALRAADSQKHSALGKPSPNDAAILRAWSGAYVQEANRYWTALGASGRSSLKDKLLRDEARERRVKLTWLLESGETAHCYGLNRFLTQLVLLAYSDSEPPSRVFASDQLVPNAPSAQPIILTAHRLGTSSSVTVGHHCGTQPGRGGARCDGHRHAVTVTRNGAAASLGEYHFVIVRHGLQPAHLFGGAEDRHQLMPDDYA